MSRDYEEAKGRLLNHASLPPQSLQMAHEESFCFHLWRAGHEWVAPAALDRLYEDILSCRETINHTLNGPTPSETVADASAPIELQLVYAVATILHEAWEYYYKWEREQVSERSILEHLARVNWAISCAWLGVLAGDIDSVREHAEEEGRARSI